jgi:hypothetical protein
VEQRNNLNYIIYKQFIIFNLQSSIFNLQSSIQNAIAKSPNRHRPSKSVPAVCWRDTLIDSENNKKK